MRKAYKSLISLAVVLIAGLNLIVPAFAQDPFTAIAIGGLSGLSGAGLFGSMAGMSGIDISWGNNTADQMDAMWNVLNPDHVYFSGEKHEATNVGEDVYDYIQVDIGDWLQAQNDFIKEFCSSYEVTDNSSGQETVVPEFAGIPFTSNSILLDSGIMPAGVGSNMTLSAKGFMCQLIRTQSNTEYHLYYNGTLSKIVYGANVDNANVEMYLERFFFDNTVTIVVRSGGSKVAESNVLGQSSTVNPVNWQSGTVDTAVFDGWEKAKVKIPSSISQLQTGWTLSDFLAELNRIWYGAGEDNIIIEEGTDQPVPPSPVPVPSTPIADVPFNDWVDIWGSNVTQKQDETNDKLDLIGSNGHDQLEELENIDTNLDDILNHTENIDTNIDNISDDVTNIDTNVADIDNHVENIDTNIEDIEDIAENIDTNLGIGNGILGGIRSLAQSAVDYLEGIAERVGELVEEIVEGTETLISGILNQIPQAFSVIFGPIKQASSIWHYVVEWIQSIGAPFQFIWSMASGTSYYIILPVYASLAAAVVLSFYKRFGK